MAETAKKPGIMDTIKQYGGIRKTIGLEFRYPTNRLINTAIKAEWIATIPSFIWIISMIAINNMNIENTRAVTELLIKQYNSVPLFTIGLSLYTEAAAAVALGTLIRRTKNTQKVTVARFPNDHEFDVVPEFSADLGPRIKVTPDHNNDGGDLMAIQEAVSETSFYKDTLPTSPTITT